jgi:tetratricopeptide (TPR) repeat protein
MDSLRALYNKPGVSDSMRLYALNKLAWEYTSNNPDTAILMANQALPMAKKLGRKSEEALDYSIIAVSNCNLGNYAKALEYYEKTLKINIETGNRMSEGRMYGNMGNVYIAQSNFPKALEYYFKAVKLSEETGDKKVSGNNYYNIGSIYLQQQNFSKSMEYFRLALKIAEEVKDKQGIAYNYINIGLVYTTEDKDSIALDYFYKAMSLELELQDKRGLATTYTNIGEVYRRQANYRRAIGFYEKSLEERRQTGDREGMGVDYNDLAGIYVSLKEYSKAFQYCDSALKIAKEIGDIDLERAADEHMAEAYSGTGNYKDAYGHYVRFHHLTDSIFNLENTAILSDLKTNYEIEKKESENKILVQQNEIQALQLNQNRIFLYGLCGLVLLVIVVAGLLLRQNKFRNEQREMQLEQKLLRSQMNPHFIFNSLQAIQNFILKNNDKDAVRFLSSYAHITRAVLENSRMELIPVKKEVKLLEHYMQLQKLRFGDRFDYVIHVDPELDTESTLIPPMLSQPFIENALEHGMQNLESGGLIDVYITSKDSMLLLEIKDNGSGMTAGSGQEKEHQSLATTITKERIALMNKKRKEKIVFSVTEAYPQQERKGVKVSFSIPVQHIMPGAFNG